MHVKKTSIIALGFLILLAACNQTAFIKKLTGTWKLSRYLYAGLDETNMMRDTTMNSFKITFNQNNSYLESWQSLAFRRDTIYPLHHPLDTLSSDTVNHIYVLKHDTIPVIDTTITPFLVTGRWDLINSESDLQLTPDSTGAVTQYQILTLSSSSLNLRSGSIEIYLSK